jgi:hypothetical protein
MTLLLTILAGAAALVVTLVTCIQLLYLESLRLRARELPSCSSSVKRSNRRSDSTPKRAR